MAMASATAWGQETQQKPLVKTKGEDIRLVVENDNYLDTHIYAMQGGLYRSLGIVTGLSTAELKVPQYLAMGGTDFQIVADPIGSSLSYMSGPIVIGSANEIDLTVAANLAFSSYMLRSVGTPGEAVPRP
jgi:hypothetical protein